MDAVLHTLQRVHDDAIAKIRLQYAARAQRLDQAIDTANKQRVNFLNLARLDDPKTVPCVYVPVYSALAPLSVLDMNRIAAALSSSTLTLPCIVRPGACRVDSNPTYEHAYTNRAQINFDDSCAWVRHADLSLRFWPRDAPVTWTLTVVNALTFELCYGVSTSFVDVLTCEVLVRGATAATCTATLRPAFYELKGAHEGTFMIPPGISTFTKACRLAIDSSNSTIAVTTRMQSSHNYVLFQTAVNLHVATTVTVDERSSLRGCAWTSANTLLVCDDGTDALFEVAPEGSVLRRTPLRHPSCVAYCASKSLVAVGCMATASLLHVYTYPDMSLKYCTAHRGTGHESVYIALSAVSFTPDGAHVAGVDHAHALHVFASGSGARVAVVPILTCNTITCMCTGFGADELLVFVTHPCGNDILSVHVTDANALLLDDATVHAHASIVSRLGIVARDLVDVVAITSTQDRLWLLTHHGLMVWS